MPPPPGLYGASLANAANTLVGAFDILINGYGEDQDAKATVYLVPWPIPQIIVPQLRGVEPRTRHYRAIVYLEADYLLLLPLINQLLQLTTPREPTAACILTSVRRGAFQDPTTPTGPLLVELDFVMLA